VSYPITPSLQYSILFHHSTPIFHFIMLAGQAQSRGVTVPGLTPNRGQGFGDLDWLAQIASQLHQQPGLLRDILSGLAGGKSTGSSAGGSAGNILSSPLAKTALAGITAMLVKKALGSR
jgi:hypothetical protein